MSSRHDALIARNITKSYGETVVLDGVSLVVGPGSRTGIVGPNGIGKSTLLRVMAGMEEPDSGTVQRQPPGARVGYLEQSSALGRRSGGEAARARLEAVIASAPDVLLLDEPTNDLDFAGLAGLAEALERFRGGLVAVSHDRAFLAGMTRILEFEAETRRVRVYAGGWAEFEAERRRAREAEERAYRDHSKERDRVVEQARRTRQWNERGYGQGRKKKKTKDARKAFERKLSRLDRVEKPWSPWRLRARARDRLTPGGDRRPARARGGRPRRLPPRPARPRDRARRTRRGAGRKRRRQDHAVAQPPRRAAAARRQRAGSGRAPSSASCRRARARSRAPRRCCARSRPRPASARARPAERWRSSASAPTTSTARAARSHPASATARCWPRSPPTA